MNKTYTLTEETTEYPTNDYQTFQLHVHDNYEIYLFLEGDVKYVIEENEYQLTSGDLIIIRKHQLHRAFHNRPKRYERVILNVEPSFFTENDCPFYEKIFTDVKPNVGSKIPTDIVKSSGIYDAFIRLKQYSNNFTDVYNVVTKSVIIEILHLLNDVNLYTVSKLTNPLINQVITYLNENFTFNVSLDDLSLKFYVSKYHLCRTFLKSTGLTVHEYLIKKRLTYAKELIKNGTSVCIAAEKSGFNNYSAFYKAFMSEYGFTPKKETSIKRK